MSRKTEEQLKNLATEKPNPLSVGLDTKSSLEIARIINSEDAKVAGAVRLALPQIARGIDWIAEALADGGRLIYVGAGTSGRIAALDAAECPPTFNVSPKQVQFIMAGGSKALGVGLEANEDSRVLGDREMRKRRPTKKDVVVGIAASGRTPFTIAAIVRARAMGAKTIAIAANPGSPLERAAELAIVVETGPEVLTGSTRMKAGTAQKMVLNMLSTGAMVRLGYVFGNLMVNMHRKNTKLAERTITILERALNVDRKTALQSLEAAGNSVAAAIVMQKAGVSRSAARRALSESKGHVRKAIARVSREEGSQEFFHG